MDRALKAARIHSTSRGLYVLRHTAATRMLKVGVQYESIAAVLGHSTTTSVRHYAHADLDALRGVALTEAEVFR
jgi:integrase